jgi:hypothetical protein
MYFYAGPLPRSRMTMFLRFRSSSNCCNSVLLLLTCCLTSTCCDSGKNKPGLHLPPRHATPYHAMPRGLTVPKCMPSCVLVFHLPLSTPRYLTPRYTTWGSSILPDIWPTRGIGWKNVAWRGVGQVGFCNHAPPNAFSSHRSGC